MNPLAVRILNGYEQKCISEYWIEIIVDSSGNARYSIRVCMYLLSFPCNSRVNRVEPRKYTSASVREAGVFLFFGESLQSQINSQLIFLIISLNNNKQHT